MIADHAGAGPGRSPAVGTGPGPGSLTLRKLNNTAIVFIVVSRRRSVFADRDAVDMYLPNGPFLLGRTLNGMDLLRVFLPFLWSGKCCVVQTKHLF